MREGPPRCGGRRSHKPDKGTSSLAERSPLPGGGHCELRPFSALGKQEGPMEQEGSRRVQAGVGKGAGRSSGDKSHRMLPFSLPPSTTFLRANQVSY